MEVVIFLANICCGCFFQLHWCFFPLVLPILCHPTPLVSNNVNVGEVVTVNMNFDQHSIKPILKLINIEIDQKKHSTKSIVYISVNYFRFRNS